MPADTTTETVTVDREAVMELLVEVNAVANVLEHIFGTCPTDLTDELTTKAERIAEAVLGEHTDPNLETGPRAELWDAGWQRARELVSWGARETPEGEEVDDAR